MRANCINIFSDLNESQAVVNLNKKYLQSITQSSSDIKTSKKLSYFFLFILVAHFTNMFRKFIENLHGCHIRCQAHH